MNIQAKLKLTIPAPCLQPWDEMAQVDNGRFCESCKKCVTDFTKLSDKELIQLFSNTNSTVCGRFYPTQLDRFIESNNSSNKQQFFPQLFLSVALGLGFLNKTAAKEIGINPLQIQSETEFEVKHQKIQISSGDSSRYITGKIIGSETKETLPFANISIKGTEFRVSSDIDGNFKLIIPDSLDYKEITLQVYCLGYEIKEVQVSIQDLPIKELQVPIKFEFIFIRHTTMTGMVVSNKPKKLTLWNRLFSKKPRG